MEEFKPFTREQMRDIVEGKKSYDRIAMNYHFWTDPKAFGENEQRVLDDLKKYPSDVSVAFVRMPHPVKAPDDDPNYRWAGHDIKEDESAGLDARVFIEDWDDSDDFFETFPDPDYKNAIDPNFKNDGRYTAGHWAFTFFERHWSLRGMENALTDYYFYPEKVHQFYQKLTDFYMRLIERCKYEYHADAMITTDDIGTQNAPFFSEDIFVEFFKPYYKQLIDKAHSLGMHYWLHTCGNVEKFIPHFIDIGLDALHPIQKHAMDEEKIYKKFGGQICFWAGFDVQQTIPYGTPEDVRKEVRHLIDTYARNDGRLVLTCGNGLTSDCPYESFHALLDETYYYGKEKMKQLHAQNV